MTDRFYVATDDEIREGIVADVYFHRTLAALTPEQAGRRVVAEMRARSLPDGWQWGVLAGVQEVVHLLRGRDINVWMLPEGSIFRPGEPVFTVEGPYDAFGLHETAFLGLLCQASGIATRAARCRLAAGDRTLLSFGARRMHPALAPMIERACYIGGCDGVSTVLAADRIGIEPTGTMPHALVLLLGDTLKAAWAFHEGVDKNVPRIVLIDTYQDEKFETLRIAKAMGDVLSGVRFDTSGSRRGDLLQIMQETRWELDIRGYRDVKFYASGGMNETEIARLNPLCDGYGIGTALSNAPTVNFAFDIVEIEGQPEAKRGKLSGAKVVTRCRACGDRRVVYRPEAPGACAPCGGDREVLNRLYIHGGEVVGDLPTATEIREHTLSELEGVTLERESV